MSFNLTKAITYLLLCCCLQLIPEVSYTFQPQPTCQIRCSLLLKIPYHQVNEWNGSLKRISFQTEDGTLNALFRLLIGDYPTVMISAERLELVIESERKQNPECGIFRNHDVKQEKWEVKWEVFLQKPTWTIMSTFLQNIIK